MNVIVMQKEIFAACGDKVEGQANIRRISSARFAIGFEWRVCIVCNCRQKN